MVISIKTLRTIFVEKNSFSLLPISFEPVESNESAVRKVFDFNTYKLALINFQCFFYIVRSFEKLEFCLF